MFRVLTCLTDSHDWRLVVLANIVCFLAAVAAINLFLRARATRGHVRAIWILTAGAASGCGIWATHFVGILAYDTGVVTGYDLGLTMLSLVLAAFMAAVGFAVTAHRPTRWGAAIGGAIIGAGIAMMHFVGMSALELPGRIEWAWDLVSASILIGIVLGAGALMVATRRSSATARFAAAFLLSLAVVAHHFTAMGAVEIAPDPTRVVRALMISPGILALAIAAIAISILGMCLIAAVGDRVSDDRLREQNIRLDAALTNMRQGLAMFDASARLVLCNERYRRMYRLPADAAQPGCTVRELLAARKATGCFNGDVETYAEQIIAKSAAGEPIVNTVALGDGRIISVVSQPIAGGGWVATHEDVTERHRAEQAAAAARTEAERAEREARAAHAHLLEAFEVVPEALALFDADDRLVLYNRRYAELFASHGNIELGERFEDILRAGLDRGLYHGVAGHEAEWLAERLARHAARESCHEQRYSDGRWVRIQERRTADGGSIGVRIDITELKRREESFRLLFESNPVPMWVYDRDTLRFLDVNDAAVAHYGYPREVFLTKTLFDVRPPEDRLEICLSAGQGEGNSGLIKRHVTADGSEIDVAIYSRSLTYNGHNARLSGLVDITERKYTEDELRRTREFLDTVIDNVPAGIYVKDARNLGYVLINRAAQDYHGASREDIIGKTVRELLPPHMAETVAAHDRAALRSRAPSFFDEHAIETRGLGERVVTTTRLPIFGPDGEAQYLVTVIHDVTERKQAEARIAHLAHHDTLTDLPNRAAFNQHFAAVFERSQKSGEAFAVMCLDLDRFKEINDVFGHAIGDALLRAVSASLRTVAQETFLARVGGDEFVVVLAGNPEPEAAARLGERLLGAVAEEFDIDGHRLRIGMSVGIAMYPGDGREAGLLLGNADAALYRAKQEGRGSVRFFEADMDKQLRDRRVLVQDLRTAAERGEIIIHYQPQARLDREVVGFEALVRWNHPVRGLVPPDMFIPVAEDSGLILPIGEWILREVCREAASWPRPLRVAVNLSPVQFRHGDLPGLVHSVLLETGLSPDRLELEITEGVLIDDLGRALSILRRLKVLGVRIAMDDFGTGYSSLSNLQSFRFDKIKIDRGFISNLETNPQSATIVRAVIGLGRGLDLPVVAEGVETSEQLAFLSAESCTEVQGYLVGRPQPIEAYADLVGRAPRRGETPAKRSSRSRKAG